MRKLPDSVWETPDQEEPMPAIAVMAPTAEPQPSEVVVAETQRQLEGQGWCLWRCSTLAGEVIVAVRDELVTRYPEGYPVYTVQELVELGEADEGVIRIAHEAKKLAGAILLPKG